MTQRSIVRPAVYDQLHNSLGRTPWLVGVLVLLVGFGTAWFLNRTGFLGSDKADYASGANASLMHLRKAMRLADAGSPTKADVEFARAANLATAPGAETWRAVSDAQAAFQMWGEARLARGEWNPAEEDFTKVIALAETRPRSHGPSLGSEDNYTFLAFLDRSLVKAHRADLDGAEGDLSSALTAIPDYSQLRLQSLKAQIDNPSKSSGAWLEYLERQGKKDGYYYLVRGQHKMLQRDFSAAILDFTESIERRYDTALNLQHRGASRLFLGDQSGAEADFKRANELTQNPGILVFFRAVLRQIDGDFDGAVSDYTEVVRLDPKPTKGPPGRRSAISTIYRYHADWFLAAASNLPQLGDVELDLASVHFNTALCYERLGRIPEAKEELHEELRTHPNFLKAERCLARLNGTK